MTPRQLFARRSVAWCLDAVILGGMALLVTRHWWSPALQRIDTSASALTGALAETLARSAEEDLAPGVALLDGRLYSVIHLLAQAIDQLLLPPMVAYALLSFIWHVASERSSWQGSPGKHWLGLQVVDERGGMPTFVQSVVRQLGSGLSWLTLNIGHLLALVPPRHAALEDSLSKTRVIAIPGTAPLRAWMFPALLAVVAALPVLGAAWVARAIASVLAP